MQLRPSIENPILFILLFTFTLFTATLIKSTCSLGISRKLPLNNEDSSLDDEEKCESLNDEIEESNGRRNRTSVQVRIAGGYDAKPGQFPSFVAIRTVINFFSTLECGGVLLSDRMILTAAHCVYLPSMAKVEVAPGIWAPKNWVQKGVKPLRVDKVCVSKVYKRDYLGQLKSDYAVLRLSEPVTLGRGLEVACLPTKPLAFGLEGFTIGTGRAAETDKSGDRLKVLPTVRIRCKDFPMPHLSRLCLAAPDRYGDTCQGDSGGPTLVNVNGTQCVYGLTSFGADVPCSYSGGRQWASTNVHGNVANIKRMMTECGSSRKSSTTWTNVINL